MDRITLRLEAARIAAQLTGVSTKNFIPVARRLERYIEGERTPARGTPTTIGDGMQYLAPGGIPSSEAESIFLQADGEKVD